jgi:uncharacterized protein (DUF3820 family)
MKMPFGKHKGEDFEDLPTSYLQWIAENLEGKDDLVEEAEYQLKLRDREGVIRARDKGERFD